MAEGTLTPNEVATVTLSQRVYDVAVTADGGDIWVTSDGSTPGLGHPSARRVVNGDTETISVDAPADPTVIKLFSKAAAGYTVTEGRSPAASPGGGGVSIPESDTPPEDPEVGDLWLDTGTDADQSGASVALGSLYITQGPWASDILFVPGHQSLVTVAVSIAQTVPAGGEVAGLWVTAPDPVPTGLVLLTARLLASNADGTEMMGKALAAPVALVAGDNILDFDADQGGAGTDLTWDPVDKVIKSTAGGDFLLMASAIVGPVDD